MFVTIELVARRGEKSIVLNMKLAVEQRTEFGVGKFERIRTIN